MREKNKRIHTNAEEGIEGNRNGIKQRKIERKIERDEMKRNKEILYCGSVCGSYTKQEIDSPSLPEREPAITSISLFERETKKKPKRKKNEQRWMMDKSFETIT